MEAAETNDYCTLLNTIIVYEKWIVIDFVSRLTHDHSAPCMKCILGHKLWNTVDIYNFFFSCSFVTVRTAIISVFTLFIIYLYIYLQELNVLHTADNSLRFLGSKDSMYSAQVSEGLVDEGTQRHNYWQRAREKQCNLAGEYRLTFFHTVDKWIASTGHGSIYQRLSTLRDLLQLKKNNKFLLIEKSCIPQHIMLSHRFGIWYQSCLILIYWNLLV